MSETEAPVKKAPFPFYPVIVAAFPVVSFFSANMAYVPVRDLWRPLFYTVGLTLVLWLVVGLITRSAARGAAAATAGTLSCFAYSSIQKISTEWLINPLGLWAVPTVLLMALAAWLLKGVKTLNVLALAIGLVTLLNIAYLRSKEVYLMARAPSTKVAGGSAAAHPDVFYIILDGHGRSDAIKRAIGFDNWSFIAGLRDRGFYVADQSHSNYCQTELSLSSSLNMGFIPDLLPNVKPKEKERAPLGNLIDNNEVAKHFRQEGYGYVSVTTGFPPVQLASADVHLGFQGGHSMIESALIAMTPLQEDKSEVQSQFVERRAQLLSAFEDLKTLAQPTAAPRLVVAHILAPHPPFVFDADGNAVPHKGTFAYMDGSDYMENIGTPAEYRKGYTGQVNFLEKKVLETVDVLVSTAAKSGKRPIIIIQGDHGSKVGLNQNSLAKTDLHEVFPILNAYLVPDEVRKDLRPEITPVNSFRLLLKDLFGEDLPPLPNRSWYSTFPLPYEFTEVTDRIEPLPPK